MRWFLALMLCGSVGFIGGGIMGMRQPLNLIGELGDILPYLDDNRPLISPDEYFVAIKGTAQSINAAERYIIVDAEDPYTAGGTRPLRIRFDDETRIRRNKNLSADENTLVMSIDVVQGHMSEISAGSAVVVWIHNYQDVKDILAIFIWYDTRTHLKINRYE